MSLFLSHFDVMMIFRDLLFYLGCRLETDIEIVSL